MSNERIHEKSRKKRKENKQENSWLAENLPTSMSENDKEEHSSAKEIYPNEPHGYHHIHHVPESHDQLGRVIPFEIRKMRAEPDREPNDANCCCGIQKHLHQDHGDRMGEK